ncbi:MAG: hypothetical protein K6G11_01105 [Lachnospiraceae bacterium]|nr:hypothetical protein [Lachnospiraceae bacterium]
MKKGLVNLFGFIFTAALVIGTLVIVYNLIPKYVHTDDLIDMVTEKLKIDLTDNGTTYKPDDLVNYPVTFDKKRTLPLKKDEEEDDQHYVEVDGYTLVLNSNIKKFKKKKKAIQEKEDDISEIVIKTITSFKEKDVTRTKITNEIVLKLQEYLESDVVVKVTLTDFKHK